MLLFLFGKRTSLKIRPKYFRLQAGIIFPSLALGFSTFVMQASESIILICFNSSLYKYGGDIAVGAMTVLSSVMQFAMLPLQGLGQGAQPIISYNYYTVPALRIYQDALLLFGIQIACQMTFTSMGNAAASVIVAVVRKFVLLLPLIYIMPLVYTADKATAVFMAEPIADTIAVLFTAILFFFQFRRFLRKMGAPSMEGAQNGGDACEEERKIHAGK